MDGNRRNHGSGVEGGHKKFDFGSRREKSTAFRLQTLLVVLAWLQTH